MILNLLQCSIYHNRNHHCNSTCNAAGTHLLITLSRLCHLTFVEYLDSHCFLFSSGLLAISEDCWDNKWMTEHDQSVEMFRDEGEWK